MWTSTDQHGMENWFFKYLYWLLTSDVGKTEAQTVNNRGTWYTIQISSILLFLDMLSMAKRVADARFYKLVSHIQSDGRQPFELVRTRSFDYSVFNLKDLFRLANMGQKIGVNLRNYKNAQGAGLNTALDYLMSHRDNWPYDQVTA